MNKRIQQFLEIENLSPSKLADMLGLQRSGISHILAGRNKPSYDFILKFLRTFPNINPDWLLMGKGKIYRNGENDQNNQNEDNTPQLSINFEENQEFYEESDEATEIKIIEKKINRITLFYNDGSFQEFYPNK
ncbi:MAG: helix-turn-helix transcriptional regulator [Bacteroidales bacterium]|jgi:plasmid maintenance system antidote protein VapI|nr:helix-turn-helix transcriptional regulator [Bacteroidales bacterium]MBQ5747341.1 helix-turn-helix transcriptional regulator [Bacteroidales bacterium]